MKKLFSKIETTGKEGGHKDNLVGKVFNVGRTTVTVEDVLAEGTLLFSLLINKNGDFSYDNRVALTSSAAASNLSAGYVLILCCS